MSEKKPAKKTLKPLLQRNRAVSIVITVLQAIGIFLGGQVIGAFFVTTIAMAAGAKEKAITDAIEQNDFVRFMLILAIEAATVWLVWLFLRRRKQTFANIYLTSKPQLKDIKTAIVGYVLYFVAFLILITIVGSLGIINTEQQQQIGFEQTKGLGLVFAFLSLVILPPIAEEIIFRGFLFHRLKEKATYAVSAGITSVLFAAAHLEFGSGSSLNWAAALDTFILSLVLCHVTNKTKSLWPAICMHAIKNVVAFSVLFLV